MKKILLSIASLLILIILPTAVSAYSPEDLGKVLFVGDSYCLATNVLNNGQEDENEGWAIRAASELQLESFDLACGDGSGLAHVGTKGNFTSLLEKYAEDHIDDETTLNWIILVAGYNDYHESYDQIMIEGEKFINRARELFPNVNIAIGMGGWHRDNEEIQAALSDSTDMAYRDLAAHTSIDYIDGVEYALYERDEEVFSNDGFHPNLIGQSYLAQEVSTFITERSDEIMADLAKANAWLVNINIATPLLIAAIAIVVIWIIFRIRMRMEK